MVNVDGMLVMTFKKGGKALIWDWDSALNFMMLIKVNISYI